MENKDLLNHYDFMKRCLINAEKKMDAEKIKLINNALIKIQEQMIKRGMQF